MNNDLFEFHRGKTKRLNKEKCFAQSLETPSLRVFTEAKFIEMRLRSLANHQASLNDHLISCQQDFLTDTVRQICEKAVSDDVKSDFLSIYVLRCKPWTSFIELFNNALDEAFGKYFYELLSYLIVIHYKIDGIYVLNFVFLDICNLPNNVFILRSHPKVFRCC